MKLGDIRLENLVDPKVGESLRSIYDEVFIITSINEGNITLEKIFGNNYNNHECAKKIEISKKLFEISFRKQGPVWVGLEKERQVEKFIELVEKDVTTNKTKNTRKTKDK